MFCAVGRGGGEVGEGWGEALDGVYIYTTFPYYKSFCLRYSIVNQLLSIQIDRLLLNMWVVFECIHPMCLIAYSYVHPMCLIAYSYVHPMCVIAYSYVHPMCVIAYSYVHPMCVIAYSYVHPMCVIAYSYVHPMCVIAYSYAVLK